jgi:hypothetical protein
MNKLENKKKILIISERSDVHVKRVLSFIDKNKVDIDIIGMRSLEDYGYFVELSRKNTYLLKTKNKRNDYYDLCWWRKPRYIEISDEYLKDPNLYHIVNSEKIVFLESIVLNINIKKWINNLSSLYNTNYKLLQLKLISEYNSDLLNVPKTIVTNNKDIIYKNFKKSFIIKSLNNQKLGVKNIGLKSTLTNIDDIKKINLNSCPVICQEFIDKAYEIRVTIIGNKIFAAKIFSHSEKSKIDFRTDYKNLTYEVYELSREMKNILLKINKYYKLNYSAIDLIVDKDEKVYFLEINPNGQYLWIEDSTGLPISLEIAKFLENY